MSAIVRHRLYQGVCAALLTSTHRQWVGDEKVVSVSPPQLNATIIISIGPGARAQELHRDDALGIGFFIAGKRTTRQNGATRFIPGSHLWSMETPPCEDLAVYAELAPGDGFLRMASCYHGAREHSQEENQYRNNDPETLKKLYGDDVDMLKLIGYDISPPYLGRIKGGYPLKALYKDYIASDDLY